MTVAVTDPDLDHHESPAAEAWSMLEQHACTFVFADLAGYTALSDVHGDECAAAVAARLFELARR